MRTGSPLRTCRALLAGRALAALRSLLARRSCRATSSFQPRAGGGTEGPEPQRAVLDVDAGEGVILDIGSTYEELGARDSRSASLINSRRLVTRSKDTNCRNK